MFQVSMKKKSVKNGESQSFLVNEKYPESMPDGAWEFLTFSLLSLSSSN